MRAVVLALLSLLIVSIVGCANAADPPSDLVISDSTVTLAAGRTKAVMAMGGPAGESLVWTSDHPEVATVTSGPDGSATITAVAVGHAMVSAATGQLAVGTDVTVTAAELDAIAIVAAHDSVPRGLTLQLAAEGTYSDKSTKDLTTEVSWVAEQPDVATVDDAGMLTAVAAGPTTIEASLGTVDATRMMTITDAALASIQLAPTPLPTTLPKGASVQLSATGKFTDLSTMLVTDEVQWESSAPDVVAVSHAGLLTGVGTTGSATITATAGSGADAVTAMLVVAAAPAALEAIAIAPAGTPLTLPLGKTQVLTATGTYSDGTTSDVTAAAMWTVASGTAVTVTPSGSAKAVSQGPATVKAAIGAVSATVDVDVGPAAVDHLAVSPATDLSLMQGQRTKLTAALVYTDGTAMDVTASATWAVTAGTSATVSAPGVIDASATGSGAATVTVTAGGQSVAVGASVRAVACHAVINEVQSQGASAGDEWVEIFNPCATALDLSGYTLVYRSANTVGTNDTNTLQSGLGTLAPGDFHLYVGSAYTGATHDGTAWSSGIGLAQASGAVGLRNGPATSGLLVDAVAYGTVMAGHPFAEGGASAPALAAGKSLARGPIDGADTDNGGSDFTVRSTPTPRAANQ